MEETYFYVIFPHSVGYYIEEQGVPQLVLMTPRKEETCQTEIIREEELKNTE